MKQILISDDKPSVLRILGASGSGKTVLIERLVEALAPLKVVVVKHTGHSGNFAENPRDTGRYLAAGAYASLRACPDGLEMIMPMLPTDFLGKVKSIFADSADLLLVESGRDFDVPTILLGEPPENARLSKLILKLPERPEFNSNISDLVRKIL